MYLHFEDWSSPPFVQEKLARSRLPHNERVIKVFASQQNPGIDIGRTALTVIEVNGDAFDESEVFAYEKRREYPGLELEEDLAGYGLSDNGESIVRSLFRFANEHGFCQAAMAAAKSTNEWLIKHPFENIDDMEVAGGNVSRERFMHLDIFFPESLEILKNIVDYDNEEAVLSWQDGVRWLRTSE